jgi:hypothetical protein
MQNPASSASGLRDSSRVISRSTSNPSNASSIIVDNSLSNPWTQDIYRYVLSHVISDVLCSTASQTPMSVSSPSIDLTKDGAELLDDWIHIAEQEVPAAARVPVPSAGVAFDLNAPNSQEAGIVLLKSMRRLLREERTPAFLAWFGDRLPGDMADYLHSSASYTMSDQ